MSLKDSVVRAYEEYVLADKGLSAGLKNLVEGSEPYNYLKCMDLLTKKGGKFTEEEKQLIEGYIAKREHKADVEYRYYFLQYDNETDPALKAEWLDKATKKSLDLTWDYQRPVGVIGQAKPEGEAAKQPGPLLDKVPVEEELDRIYKRTRTVDEFSTALLSKLNFSKLSKEDFMRLITRMGTDLVMLNNDAFFNCYAEHLKKDYKEHQYYTLETEVLSKMTLEQLEKMLKRLPKLQEDMNFSGHYLRKKFFRELAQEADAELPLEVRRKALITLYEYAKNLPPKQLGLKSHFLFEILDNGIKLDKFEEEYFLAYLEQPLQHEFTKNKVAPSPSKWGAYVPSTNNDFVQEDVIKEYLHHFFSSGETIDKYRSYISKELLIDVFDRAMITSGKKVDMTKYNAKKLERINAEVSIVLCPFNKTAFRIGEDISVWLELKNIPTLYVKVFEINTESYYRTKMKPIKTDINLEGLVAAMERTVDHKQTPNLLYREEIKLPELKGKRGLFIIELIGNGKCSRAVIKLGTLSLVQVPTIAGQLCYILDEDRKICAKETTDIWIDNTQYKADLAKGGRIIIPYAPSSKSSKAILNHEGTSQLIEFQRLEEEYTLKSGFFLLPDSMVAGATAIIAIHPQLLVNGRAGDLALLKNIKCTCLTSNYVDSLSSTKVFDNLVVSQKEEILIPLHVPSNLKDLSLQLSADISNISKNKKQTLTVNYSFPVFCHSNDQAITELYLKSGPKGYIALLLGKNGEPISGASVNFSFTTPYFSYNIAREGRTNSEGVINLGELQNVTAVRAVFVENSTTMTKDWQIPPKINLNVPYFLDIIEGEVAEVPYSAEQEGEAFYVLREDRREVYEDLPKAITVEKKPGSLYSVLRVKGLDSGAYTLFGTNTLRIAIKVHKGIYWPQNVNYILKENSLVEKTERLDYIKINSVKIEKKEKNAAMEVEVVGSTADQWRLHVFLLKYMPTHLSTLTKQFLGKEEVDAKEDFFPIWKNFYLSNRQLSSEFRYCFDRKNLKRYIGNTLEKPKLVLKRELVGSTTTMEEEYVAGTDYAQVEEEKMQTQVQIERNKPQKKGKQEKKNKIMKEKRPNMKRGRESEKNNPIYPFVNFLADQPVSLFNIPSNPSGKITIELDSNYESLYSFVYVVAVDKSSTAHYLCPLPGTNIKKKDLSLTACLDPKKSYCQMRTASCVLKNESHIIQDLSSTEYQIIDSLEKAWMAVKELNRVNSITVPFIDKFEKILQWDQLSEEDKTKIFSNLSSHELNLFLYKKDPEFFNSVVKPHLANKMEKTLVDFYLLQDKENAIAMAESPALYDSFNPLEKALVIEMLVETGKKDMAVTFAKRLRDAMNKRKLTASQQNRIFDSILALNVLKAKKEDMEEVNMAKISDTSQMAALPSSSVSYSMSSKPMYKKAYKEKARMIEESDLMEERQEQLQSMEELGQTKEYGEAQYYGEPNPVAVVDYSDFWADYAEYVIEGAGKGFLSSYFTHTCATLPEIVGALSLLDLPYKAIEHGYKTTGGKSAELKAANNFIIFKKEIKETKENIRSDLLVAQRYNQAFVGDTSDSKIEEFLVRGIYSCEVIITNISSQKQELEVLLQIPQGAMPVGASPYQRSHSVLLQSYSTTKLSYMFYFPAPGSFLHFPASVSINSVIVTKASENTLKVVNERSIISETNFREVLASGNHDMILNIIKQKPIEKIKGFSWEDFYWLLKDEKFFTNFMKLMKSQGRFENRAWSFALYHKKDATLISEYLNDSRAMKDELGYYFDCSLIKVRPKNVEMRHLDYFPLINPRAHNISKQTGQRMILNNEFYTAYKEFILCLMQKPSLELDDKMKLTYYLLLQDRIKEALSIYAKIAGEKEVPKEGKLRLQYDYMTAYLDFYTGAPKFALARKISEHYTRYPVVSWRLMFQDIDQQLKEYDGIIEAEVDEESKDGKKKKVEAKTPQMNLALEGKDIVIDYSLVTDLTIKYYLIDLEILFSRTPFLTQNTKDFSFVKANLVQAVALDPKLKTYRQKIPELYLTKNVVVEAYAGGMQAMATYFSTSLQVHIFENYGELKITDEGGKQLSQVYVKAFALTQDEKTTFYKDGYTDIRGRFDYVSLNASNVANVKKYALFILSETHGSLIRECAPPPVTIRAEEELVNVKGRVADYYGKKSEMQKYDKKKK